MAGSWRTFPSVLVFFFVLIPSANAFHGRWGGGATPSVSYHYYWPAPYYFYCPPPVAVIPLQNTCEAVPIPAPPSQSAEPPLPGKADLRAPIINSTRSLGGTYNSGTAPPSKDRCKVGFWNLTGRDVTLTIEGKSWPVPKNRKMTLDLAHEFSWQIERGPQQVERVPDNQATHEVTIRD